jgi:predicted nucleic acid-binding protein
MEMPLVTTNFIVDELITLLIARGLSFSAFEGMVDDLMAGKLCRVERVDSVVETAAWHFLKKHSDQRFSFTDCTSFLTMKSLGIRQVIALDHHFEIAGFEVLC